MRAKNGVFFFSLNMKLQRISDFQHSFSFLSATENFDAFYARFLESDLGKIYQAIPWEALVENLSVSEKATGSKMLFSPKGRIALMLLKHYACCSDKKLIEQLNSNIDYQFFCDIHLGFHRLTNFKIVSQIRCELSDKLSIDSLEKVLYTHWSPYIDSKSQITVNATCYESELRYPTPRKLLREAVDWLYMQLKKTCKLVGVKMIRSKYIKWKKRYFGFSKMRRKTTKKRKPLTRALLHLLGKLIDFEKELRNTHNLKFKPTYYKRVATIKKVSIQQQEYFDTGVSPKNRIVSIQKDYLRPIVRGKEVKPVEFGAKVNKLQIDGPNFIEHLNFNAFNEGARLKSTIYKAQSLTKVKTKIVGADAIYATNKNRKFITKNNIKTDFKRKGKIPKNYLEEKKLKTLITKVRATRLEGSFGKEKNTIISKRLKPKLSSQKTLDLLWNTHC